MTIVDGRALAAEVRASVAAEIQAHSRAPKLGILACNPNFETETYLELKEKLAATLGVVVERVVLPVTATTEEVLQSLAKLSRRNDGLIVQLPLPAHIDREQVLLAVPKEKDVDVFSYQGETTTILPPVVGAINEIAQRHGVSWQDKKVVIFGSGKLVGLPMQHFARTHGAVVSVVTADTDETEAAELARQADIIILGAGKAGILTPDMVTAGVSVFDAGASEDGGVLVGDADPAVAPLAFLFTPVPGGIGPLTVAMLFRNLLELAKRQ